MALMDIHIMVMSQALQRQLQVSCMLAPLSPIFPSPS